MRTKRNTLYILATMLLLATASCSRNSDGPSGPSEGTHLRLRLEMPRTVRSESHPDWSAFDAENAVHDITVFFFNNDRGLNGAADTPIVSAVYVDKGFVQGQNYLSVEVPLDEDYEYRKGDRITVTVNMGDLTILKTLGDLQAYFPKDGAWTYEKQYSPLHCTSFTMGPAFDNEGIMVYAGDNVHDYYTATVSVERTAARIDLEYESREQEQGDYLKYESISRKEGNQVNGEVRVYGITPINSMQRPSYALKRITNGLSEDMSCFSKWHYTGTLINSGTRPQAYVLEPHTITKADGATVPPGWYGATEAATLNGADWDAADALNVDALLADQNIKFSTDTGYGLVVSYTNENTQHYTQHSSKWLTGLLFRAVFVPATVYSDGNAETVDAAYAAGDTFWRYRKTNVSTSEDDALYFSNHDAASTYAMAHSGDNAEITEYPQGRCFYHMWLRHTVEDRDPQIVFPMEYGIVRNHIYRVKLTFRGVGNPSPDIDEPENAKAAIYVRPWNVFRHTQIII